MVGIYAIQNNINGKLYIGQSIDIERRWKDEQTCKGAVNDYLTRSFEKYGIQNFSFYIIEECKKEDLNNREKFYIKLYHSLDNEFGYNLTSGGDSQYSRPYQKISEEHKKKISLANKGRKRTLEEIEKMKTTKQKNLLESHKIDIWCYETNITYHSIEECIEKLGIRKDSLFRCLRKAQESANGFHICYDSEKNTRIFNFHPLKGKVGGTKGWNENTIEKIRQSKLGKKRPKEVCEKLKIANTGKVLSEEHKRKISESQIGMKRKEGTGKNISEAKKKAYREKATTLILCIETGETFYSSYEAEEILRKSFPKVNADCIKIAVKDNKRTSGGLHFKRIPIEK